MQATFRLTAAAYCATLTLEAKNAKENGFLFNPDGSGGTLIYKTENMQVLARRKNRFLVKSNKSGNFYLHIENGWFACLMGDDKLVLYQIDEKRAFDRFWNYDEKFVKAEDVFNLVRVGFEDA